MTDDQVLASLKERIERVGPIEILVAPHEFEVLKVRVRTLWQQQGWDEDEDYILLAYLRAYTFYRELTTNERVFWKTFFDFLGLPEETDRCYNGLADMLESNTYTRALFITNRGQVRNRREFVKSIDDIWGVRSLSGVRLAQLFRRYYLSYAGVTVTRQLLANLLGYDADEVALRQVASYNHIFCTLNEVVNLILTKAKEIDGLSAQDLTLWLQGQGVELKEPNAVVFLYNKAPTVLPDLIHRLRGTLRLKNTAQIARNEEAVITLREGFFYEGEPIELEFDETPEINRELRLYNWQGQQFRLHRLVSKTLTLSGRLALPIGGYWIQVFSEGEPLTLQKPLHVLPVLKWEPNIYHKPLIENTVITGKVLQEDGDYFGLFRWQPQWHYEKGQWYTRPSQIQVELDAERGLRLEADVVAESLGCRFVNMVTGQVLEQLEISHLAEVSLSQPTSVWSELRVYLESQPEYSVQLRGGQLDALSSLIILNDDVLIIEKKIYSAWHFLKRIPVSVSATVEQTLRALYKSGVGWGTFG